MPKVVGTWRLIIRGRGETLDGAKAEVSYSTESDIDPGHRSRTKRHRVESPTWPKTVSSFLMDEIAAIKEKEGIS